MFRSPVFLRIRRAINPLGLVALAVLLGLSLQACGLPFRERTDKTAEVHKPANGESNQDQTDEADYQSTPGNCMNDFEPIPLPRLIGTAELVVVGQVEEVQEETFSFRVQSVLVGESVGQSIDVIQYVPRRFECPRAAPYESGQAFMLFLTQDPEAQDEQRWRILGIVGEGEMPLENGFVYFHGRFVEGLERDKYVVHGAERVIQRYQADAFEAAVRNYRHCFVWETDPTGERPEPSCICSDSDLKQYRSQSDIHEYLTLKTLVQIPE